MIIPVDNVNHVGKVSGHTLFISPRVSAIINVVVHKTAIFNNMDFLKKKRNTIIAMGMPTTDVKAMSIIFFII